MNITRNCHWKYKQDFHKSYWIRHTHKLAVNNMYVTGLGKYSPLPHAWIHSMLIKLNTLPLSDLPHVIPNICFQISLLPNLADVPLYKKATPEDQQKYQMCYEAVLASNTSLRNSCVEQEYAVMAELYKGAIGNLKENDWMIVSVLHSVWQLHHYCHHHRHHCYLYH